MKTTRRPFPFVCFCSGVLAIALGTFSVSSAHAQEPGGTTSVKTNDDVVKLKSGAIFRGTISALVPGDRVEILLATGETKQFHMFDVAYAGALAGLPVARTLTPVPVPVEAAPASTLRFQAAGEATSLTLGEVTGDIVGGRGTAYTFRALCTAPCTPDLGPGPHRVLLWGVGSPSIAYPIVVPPGPSTLRATTTLHGGARGVGFGLIYGGVLGGAALLVVDVLATSNDPATAPLIAGPVLIMGGLIAGIAVLVSNPDEVHLEVLPGLSPISARTPSWMQAEVPRADARSSEGLTLRLRF